MTVKLDGVNLDPFPAPGNGRELYFVRCGEAPKAELEGRGYVVVLIGQLPRSTKEEEKQYLIKKAQGIEVGTILVDDMQANALRLLFKHTGLLDENRGGVIKEESAKKQSVVELLAEARSKESRYMTKDTSFGRDVTAMLDQLEEAEDDGSNGS